MHQQIPFVNLWHLKWFCSFSLLIFQWHPSLSSQTKNHNHLVSQTTPRILYNWSRKQGQNEAFVKKLKNEIWVFVTKIMNTRIYSFTKTTIFEYLILGQNYLNIQIYSNIYSSLGASKKVEFVLWLEMAETWPK